MPAAFGSQLKPVRLSSPATAKTFAAAFSAHAVARLVGNNVISIASVRTRLRIRFLLFLVSPFKIKASFDSAKFQGATHALSFLFYPLCRNLPFLVLPSNIILATGRFFTYHNFLLFMLLFLDVHATLF